MGYFIPQSVVSVVVFSWSKISVVGDLMFLVVTNTREHFLRYFALLRLTEAWTWTCAVAVASVCSARRLVSMQICVASAISSHTAGPLGLPAFLALRPE